MEKRKEEERGRKEGRDTMNTQRIRMPKKKKRAKRELVDNSVVISRGE